MKPPNINPIDLNRTFSVDEVNALIDDMEARAHIRRLIIACIAVCYFGIGLLIGMLLP